MKLKKRKATAEISIANSCYASSQCFCVCVREATAKKSMWMLLVLRFWSKILQKFFCSWCRWCRCCYCCYLSRRNILLVLLSQRRLIQRSLHVCYIYGTAPLSVIVFLVFFNVREFIPDFRFVCCPCFGIGVWVVSEARRSFDGKHGTKYVQFFGFRRFAVETTARKCVFCRLNVCFFLLYCCTHRRWYAFVTNYDFTKYSDFFRFHFHWHRMT